MPKTLVRVGASQIRTAVRTAYDVKLTKEAQGKINEIVTLVDQVGKLADEGRGMTVKDAESNAVATDFVSRSTKALKALEELRKYFTKPLNDRVGQVNARFKEWIAELKEVSGEARKQGDAYFMAEREKARKEEEKRRQQHEEETKASRALGGGAPEPAQPLEVEAPKKTTYAGGGSVTRKVEWVHQVVDPQAVPRKYLVVDDRLIKQDVKNGVREIPGVKIFERAVSSAR